MTQNGRQIRLKGLGMPSLDARKKGDLIARIRLVIPDDISDDERALFEQLRAIRKQQPAGSR
jgi:DnaJ-class molecular chaperone